jgi:hypothetical protein
VAYTSSGGVRSPQGPTRGSPRPPAPPPPDEGPLPPAPPLDVTGESSFVIPAFPLEKAASAPSDCFTKNISVSFKSFGYENVLFKSIEMFLFFLKISPWIQDNPRSDDILLQFIQ